MTQKVITQEFAESKVVIERKRRIMQPISDSHLNLTSALGIVSEGK